MKRYPTLFAFIVLILATPAAAQQQKGDVELEFLGSLTTTVGTEHATGLGVIQSKFGRFFTDRLELGAFPSLEVRIINGEADTKLGFGLFAVYSYLSPDAMTVPYVGASYYKSDLSAGFDAEDSWLGVNAGLKYYFLSNVAFDMGANYLFSLYGADEGLLILQAGISFLL